MRGLHRRLPRRRDKRGAIITPSGAVQWSAPSLPPHPAPRPRCQSIIVAHKNCRSSDFGDVSFPSVTRLESLAHSLTPSLLRSALFPPPSNFPTLNDCFDDLLKCRLIAPLNAPFLPQFGGMHASSTLVAWPPSEAEGKDPEFEMPHWKKIYVRSIVRRDQD